MADASSELDRGIDFAMAEFKRVGDAEKLPPAVRTVLLVQAAQGVIDNGGFQYFFENDWLGQPAYAEFVDAYRAIGVGAEADALAAAAALFPFAEPHKHREKREEFLSRFRDGNIHRPDSPFELYDRLCGNKEVWRLLEAYVCAHGDAFRS